MYIYIYIHIYWVCTKNNNVTYALGHQLRLSLGMPTDRCLTPGAEVVFLCHRYRATLDPAAAKMMLAMPTCCV